MPPPSLRLPEALELPPGWRTTRRLLVAVSGGRDSVALLHALVEAGYRRLVVCHFNHRLRGRASGGDARFVAALARRLGVEYEGGVGDVRAAAREGRLSEETAARELRYRFFAQVARKRRCRTLLLGHHADDQAETLLWNFLRGSGRAGLGGVRPLSHRTIGGTELTLVRPLLHLWRAEVDAYIATRRLAFREDATNATLGPVRNRLRHQLLPLLEAELGRAIRPRLVQTAALLRDEEAWLEEQTQAAYATLADGETLRAPAVAALPVPLQRRVLRHWLQARGVPGVGLEVVETVRTLLAPGGPAKVNLPQARHARRREKRLFVEGRVNGERHDLHD